MEELKNFICDKWLGSGVHRAVHVYALDETKVVKIALGQDGRMYNLLEAKIWAEIRDTKFAKWFAPVHRVSDAGQWLIMDRAEFGRKGEYPKMIPHFFYDLKYSNYGFIKNQFKCIDYGSMVVTNGFTDKMKKAEWWE